MTMRICYNCGYSKNGLMRQDDDRCEACLQASAFEGAQNPKWVPQIKVKTAGGVIGQMAAAARAGEKVVQVEVCDGQKSISGELQCPIKEIDSMLQQWGREQDVDHITVLRIRWGGC